MDTTLELINLEQLLEGDCECESQHDPATAPICSQVVVALKEIGCRNQSFKICTASLDWNLSVLDHWHLCASCARDTVDCWTIRPI